MDINLIEEYEPATYEETIQGIDFALWQDVLKSEMDYMYTNQVWTLVDAPECVKFIGSKWVFKSKIDMDGNIQTYKARLVAKGYRHQHDVDYNETFYQLPRLNSFR